MNELEAQIRDAFLEYGSAEFVSDHLIKDILEFEVKYKTEGYFGDVVPRSWDDYILTAVSYTHLTLPTKRIV